LRGRGVSQVVANRPLGRDRQSVISSPTVHAGDRIGRHGPRQHHDVDRGQGPRVLFGEAVCRRDIASNRPSRQQSYHCPEHHTENADPQGQGEEPRPCASNVEKERAEGRPCTKSNPTRYDATSRVAARYDNYGGRLRIAATDAAPDSPAVLLPLLGRKRGEDSTVTFGPHGRMLRARTPPTVRFDSRRRVSMCAVEPSFSRLQASFCSQGLRSHRSRSRPDPDVTTARAHHRPTSLCTSVRRPTPSYRCGTTLLSFHAAPSLESR